MAEIGVVSPPQIMYRIARASNPTDYSRIQPGDASSGRSGNRYDVPGGGVLYCATSVRTCFAEILAAFRPTPAMRALLKDADSEESQFMLCGGIPQDWRLQRRILEIRLIDPLPFVDVEAAGTLTVLESQLASELVALGYREPIDLSDIRNKDRRLSRAIAAWAYVAQDDLGNATYSGIRYGSRVDKSQECWAVFEGGSFEVISQKTIELDNRDLQSVADDWDLRPF